MSTTFSRALAVLCTAVCTSAASPSCNSGPTSVTVSLTDEGNGFALSNGFVCVVVEAGKIVEASGDFNGQGLYGANTLGDNGASLLLEDAEGAVFSSASHDVTVNVREQTDSLVEMVVNDIHVSDGSGLFTATEEWIFRLESNSRAFDFDRRGVFHGPSSGEAQIKSLLHQWDLVPTSITGFYENPATLWQSVAQMKSAPSGGNFFPSQEKLLRTFALGGPGSEEGQVGNASIDFTFGPDINSNKTTVLLSSNSGDPYWSGLQEVLFGGGDNSWFDHWGLGWESVAPHVLVSNISWTTAVRIAVNNRDFPAGGVESSTASNLPDKDLSSMLTGIYASPVGALCTHKNEVVNGAGVSVGQIATTIARPDRGYSGTYNYFDPDNYISTSALLYSGDSFLQNQVRVVLERSGAFLTEEGQLPHHFDGIDPVYQALSGEIQTGPNVFWILSCFTYAKTSGNFDWLVAYMPTLRLASHFLFDLVDDNVGLANVPGSLMIDVFLRSNFTSDTNAMLVGFFREFAEAEAHVGNATGASDLNQLADSIAANMNNKLWCSDTGGICADAKSGFSSDGDHFVTQWDGFSDGHVRDFVDYDSNLIACAHGVPTDVPGGGDDGGARARRILRRVDGGQCRASQTFVSERYYGPSDTTDGNTGDSWCAMGRIAWFDSLSRRRYGDDVGFSQILAPLQAELLKTTWMHERWVSFLLSFAYLPACMIHSSTNLGLACCAPVSTALELRS